ncbi:MAG TPA: MiaB/RimO family radical SAM methylthiotransferase, partial [Dissulfurispiraceae bacterium]
MNKIHITTLGCPKNSVDSGHLGKAFLSQGFTITGGPEDADVLLVNTCGFIKDAKEESIEEVLELAKLKSRTRKKLLVFGCLAARYRDELLKEIPEIDALWGVGEDEKIIEYCKGLRDAEGKGQKAKGKEKEAVAPCPAPCASSYAYLKIAEGCDKKCTFCVIPSIRGKFRSNPAKGILEEAKEYIRRGTRELILVAQDITNYGKEAADYNLVSLLKDLASLDGDFRIRLLYLYPTAVSDELIDYMAAEPRIQKYLDIPLQHSEDRILRLMGRRG